MTIEKFDGFTPVAYSKGEPMFSQKQVNTFVVNESNSEDNAFVARNAKTASNNFKTAEESLTNAEKMFESSTQKFLKTSEKLNAEVKKTAGLLKKSGDDLASGLARVEKQANFSNLERYVTLLERAAAAMQSLAELEKSGKLEKIAGALK